MIIYGINKLICWLYGIEQGDKVNELMASLSFMEFCFYIFVIGVYLFLRAERRI